MQKLNKENAVTDDFRKITTYMHLYASTDHLQDFVASFLSIDGQFYFGFEGSQFEAFRQIDEGVHNVGAKTRVDVLGAEFADAITESCQTGKVTHHHQILKRN